MIDSNEKPTIILRSNINSFHYLYQDAEYFLASAKKPELTESFERVRFCRTALLLFIFSLEGLINHALDDFLPLIYMISSLNEKKNSVLKINGCYFLFFPVEQKPSIDQDILGVTLLNLLAFGMILFIPNTLVRHITELSPQRNCHHLNGTKFHKRQK